MASSMPGKPSTFELHLQFTAAHLEVPLLPRAIWDAEEGSWGSAVGYTCVTKCDTAPDCRAVVSQRFLAQPWVGDGSRGILGVRM